MTDAPSTSFMTAISVLDTLVRAGMRHVLIAPGSRSAPLAYALAALDQAGAIEAHVRIDERSAAFTALGLAKASGQPVGIVTTSGTAVGECLPALMEAYHTGAPLALLSADRPARLQGTGANQTTDQQVIAPAHTRASCTLENYTADPTDPQSAQLNAALAALTGRSADNWDAPSTTPRGPVQINLALDTPLTPNPLDQQILERWVRSLAENPPAPATPLPPADPSAARWLRAGTTEGAKRTDGAGTTRRTVVVAGDGAGPIAQVFAQQQGLPLLAEPSSNARFSPLAVPAYRQVLAGHLGQQVERAVIFGHPTLSRPVATLLANSKVKRALYAPSPAPWYEPGALDLREIATLAELADFAGTGQGATTEDGHDWITSWSEAGQELARELNQQIANYRAGTYTPNAQPGASSADRTAGYALAEATWQSCLDDDAVLMVGSSNLIRDLDLIAPSLAASPLVFANRGLAGIDGTIATASGISLALNRPVRVLVGDLTFLHDTGSLNIGPLERKPNLDVLVYDDRGGGIFSTLEHGQLAQHEKFAPAVRRFFTTPHTAQLEELAAAWGENGIRVRVVRP
ncbi:2-succinyl-5-enolpyruvyl-6-hydroxy-3-cyclohexene-1-carboxylic-acid synthase [Rothia nasimurium]|uniref:2-succinyl-5-enolpyruvyl-6-hydroxy-3- cyclohexene-1-carboxylic-acid synthase n=1 Tax=Rothia nasimurium TaxID=85336 RepID=UPI001628C1D2|nr:2-succinyl-5-enolpyruvyl-6-hydroxy-3-cyclohexene-1-carboxylic-acid synthase [Rothia nasimurium]